MRWGRRKKAAGAPSALFLQVEAALGELRAYAASHGGRIDLADVADDGVVTVRFRGACAFCPLADLTFHAAVEKRLLAVPGVTKVIRR